jgi:hypothetical protein
MEELAHDFKTWKRSTGDFTNYYIIEVEHRRQIYAREHNNVATITNGTYYAMVYDTLALYNQ